MSCCAKKEKDPEDVAPVKIKREESSGGLLNKSQHDVKKSVSEPTEKSSKVVTSKESSNLSDEIKNKVSIKEEQVGKKRPITPTPISREETPTISPSPSLSDAPIREVVAEKLVVEPKEETHEKEAENQQYVDKETWEVSQDPESVHSDVSGERESSSSSVENSIGAKSSNVFDDSVSIPLEGTTKVGSKEAKGMELTDVDDGSTSRTEPSIKGGEAENNNPEDPPVGNDQLILEPFDPDCSGANNTHDMNESGLMPGVAIEQFDNECEPGTDTNKGKQTEEVGRSKSVRDRLGDMLSLRPLSSVEKDAARERFGWSKNQVQVASTETQPAAGKSGLGGAQYIDQTGSVVAVSPKKLTEGINPLIARLSPKPTRKGGNYKNYGAFGGCDTDDSSPRLGGESGGWGSNESPRTYGRQRGRETKMEMEIEMTPELRSSDLHMFSPDIGSDRAGADVFASQGMSQSPARAIESEVDELDLLIKNEAKLLEQTRSSPIKRRSSSVGVKQAQPGDGESDRCNNNNNIVFYDSPSSQPQRATAVPVRNVDLGDIIRSKGQSVGLAASKVKVININLDSVIQDGVVEDRSREIVSYEEEEMGGEYVGERREDKSAVPAGNMLNQVLNSSRSSNRRDQQHYSGRGGMEGGAVRGGSRAQGVFQEENFSQSTGSSYSSEQTDSGSYSQSDNMQRQDNMFPLVDDLGQRQHTLVATRALVPNTHQRGRSGGDGEAERKLSRRSPSTSSVSSTITKNANSSSTGTSGATSTSNTTTTTNTNTTTTSSSSSSSNSGSSDNGDSAELDLSSDISLTFGKMMKKSRRVL